MSQLSDVSFCTCMSSWGQYSPGTPNWILHLLTSAWYLIHFEFMSDALWMHSLYVFGDLTNSSSLASLIVEMDVKRRIAAKEVFIAQLFDKDVLSLSPLWLFWQCLSVARYWSSYNDQSRFLDDLFGWQSFVFRKSILTCINHLQHHTCRIPVISSCGRRISYLWL